MPRRRDTPVDGALAVRGHTSAALELSTAGGLEQTFERWVQLRVDFASALQRLAADRHQLEDQGSLLLGAVRFAQAPAAEATSAALTTGGPLAEAEATVARARASLEASQQALTGEYALRSTEARAAVLAQVAQFAAKASPVVQLMVRNVGQERRILHLQRPVGDEAVLLLRALSGRVPSRYGFLFDDSTDDATLAPPVLYAEEGVLPAQVRSSSARLAVVLERLPEVWPVKGMLPMLGGGPFVRWLSRGPVLEAEVADGEGFRNLLSRDEAEHLTARLLTLKLEGKLGLELGRG